MDGMIFEARNLEITYKGGVRAVKGVSLELAAGKSLGIVGESGSGKSSLVKMMMLLQRPTAGELLYRGRNAFSLDASMRKAFRRDVQMVFQDAVGSLNPRMTIRQTLKEVVTFTKSDAKIPELLDIVGLSAAVLDQYPMELSGGQCQRASFARALAVKPSVIIADEPVSALDVSVQARILNLMRDLQKQFGIAMILISHDLAVVKNVCDDVCVMKDGLFVEQGVTAKVFEKPSHEYTKKLLSAVPDVKRALASR